MDKHAIAHAMHILYTCMRIAKHATCNTYTSNICSQVVCGEGGEGRHGETIRVMTATRMGPL
eukprot:1484462-Pyramimonas_sp.AAC.1